MPRSTLSACQLRMRIRAPLAVIEIMAVAMQTEDFPYLPSGPAEVNKMIKEHGDLFSDSQCKVCSAVLISESQKLTHYQSKKHANKVRRYLSIQSEKEPALKKLKSSPSDCNNGDTDRSKVCHVCNMTFSSAVVAESHYQGKVHAKNLRLKTVGPQTPAVASQTPPPAQPKKKPVDDSSSAPAAGGGNNNNNNPDRFCSICQASFNNPLMAQQHYVGKKHRKQMTKLKLMETYGPSTAPGHNTQPGSHIAVFTLLKDVTPEDKKNKTTILFYVSTASTLKGYPCTICNIELNSVEQYQSHISGAKHKNQVKKSGLNTTENQEAAEQSYGGDNQHTAPDNQYAPVDDQYAPVDDQYAPVDDQFGAAEDQYTAGDNQYAPEDTEYSEEYQFT